MSWNNSQNRSQKKRSNPVNSFSSSKSQSPFSTFSYKIANKLNERNIVNKKQKDRWEALHQVRNLTQLHWVTLDTETTGLGFKDQVVQWSVCAPDGTCLGEGFVKPTVPISEGAQAIHGISMQMVKDAPTFDQVLPVIQNLISGKVVIIYNAPFDLDRLIASIKPYVANNQDERLTCLKNLERRCAMSWFAVIYGVRHSYYDSYTFQKLTTACDYFAIPFDDSHTATGDARATAALVNKMIELAQTELPSNYHPPVFIACAGGCGRETGPFSYDQEKTWYCGECGLQKGIYHICPNCQQTIVASFDYRIGHARNLGPVQPGQLCGPCVNSKMNSKGENQ
jgi:DNA polymerase-3 subunit epsilon